MPPTETYQRVAAPAVGARASPSSAKAQPTAAALRRAGRHRLPCCAGSSIHPREPGGGGEVALPRDQPLAGELRAGLLERDVGRRQDHVGLLELLVAELRPRPRELEHLPEQPPEALLVPRLDEGDDLVVQLVQPRGLPVLQTVLALGRDADDHLPSPAFSPAPLPASSAGLPPPPGPSSAFIFASSASTSLELVSSFSWRSMSSLPPESNWVRSSKVPAFSNSSTA